MFLVGNPSTALTLDPIQNCVSQGLAVLTCEFVVTLDSGINVGVRLLSFENF